MAVTRVLLPVLLLVGCGGGSPTPEQSIDCDVVVIGGSVAGLAAAVTAAKEGALFQAPSPYLPAACAHVDTHARTPS